MDQKVPEPQWVRKSSVFWLGGNVCALQELEVPLCLEPANCDVTKNHSIWPVALVGLEQRQLPFPPIVFCEGLCSTSVSRTLRWRNRLNNLVSLWSEGAVTHRLSMDQDPLELHKPYALRKGDIWGTAVSPPHTHRRCAHECSDSPSTPSRQHRPQQSIVLISYSPTTGF